MLFSTLLIFISNRIRTPFLSLSQDLRRELACRVFFMIGQACSQITTSATKLLNWFYEIKLWKSPLSGISIGPEALRRWDLGSRASIFLMSPISLAFMEEKVNVSLFSVLVITGLMPEKIYIWSEYGHKFKDLAKKKCATFTQRNAYWQTLDSSSTLLIKTYYPQRLTILMGAYA